MISELRPDSFEKALPLYRTTGMCFPLILAVIQNQQRGQIFVDERENPGSAVVVTDFGFMSFLGVEQNDKFNAGFADLLAGGKTIKPTYLLWYSPPISWQQWLDVRVPDSVRRRERMRFEFREECADYLDKPVQCPPGFELKNLDADLILKTEKFGLNIESRFWSSATDFIEHGLGLCLIKGNEVASLCYSACVADALAEIDIVTDPEFRGQGLGTFVAQQFIKGCLHKGIIPTWDCFESNVASVRLAEKLGFRKIRTYPFYSFNVPIELREEPTSGGNSSQSPTSL